MNPTEFELKKKKSEAAAETAIDLKGKDRLTDWIPDPSILPISGLISDPDFGPVRL